MPAQRLPESLTLASCKENDEDLIHYNGSTTTTNQIIYDNRADLARGMLHVEAIGAEARGELHDATNMRNAKNVSTAHPAEQRIEMEGAVYDVVRYSRSGNVLLILNSGGNPNPNKCIEIDGEPETPPEKSNCN